MRHVCTAALICIFTAICKVAFFFFSFLFFFHPLREFFGLMLTPIVKALCEARVPLHHTEHVYIQGWAESRHIMRPNVGAPQRSSPASAVEYGAEAAIQSIRLLCGSETQKRYKHRPGLYAQTCTGSPVARRHTHTHTHSSDSPCCHQALVKEERD